MEIPYYWKSMNWDRFIEDYPPPPLYERTVGRMSAEEVRALQERRFLERVEDAWRTPFYAKRWTDAGIEPGDITGLDDLPRIPSFDSEDVKEALAEQPPFGSHQPLMRADFANGAIKIQTSGGTTGMPRVTLFDQRAWEVQAVTMARQLYAQGARPGHIMQIPMTASLANAGWTAYCASQYWLGLATLTTGSGVVTSSERQLDYARAYGTNIWYSFPEYLARLAEVAAAGGFDVRDLPTEFLHSYLGADVDGTLRHQLQEVWGAPVYDNYGTHEVGNVAFECREQSRMHVHDDVVFLEVVDVDSGEALQDGEEGNLVATNLYRNVPLYIRYNLRDKLRLFPRDTCACGLETRRLSTFLGRSDEMIKLRGQNVFPMACQNSVTSDPRTTGEFLCVVEHVGQGLQRKEELTVRVERAGAGVDRTALEAAMVEALHRDLGVRVAIEIVEPGTLARFTGLGGEGKVKRLLDLRK